MLNLKKTRQALAALALLIAAGAAGHAQAASFTAHVGWANTLIANVASANNEYTSDVTVVTWPGVKGATKYESRATCAPFVSTLIKTANGLSDSDYKARTGSYGPSSRQYHALILAQKNFTRIVTPAAIQAGDVIAVNYLPCANQSATGHTMVAMSAAVQRATDTAPIIPGTVQWEVTIADSTSSPHGATDANGTPYLDTRGANDGAGKGTLRLYQNTTTGEIAGYTWTMSSGSVYYSVESCRTIAVGRMF